MNDRRLFLKSTAAAAVVAATAHKTLRAADATPSETVSLGMMGVNGRGRAITSGMLAQPNTRIDIVCDVDSRAANRVADMVAEKQKTRPKVVTDFRHILDDANIDALVCAAPNHWHAPATILGCDAGKHVYVEKPCSQTPAEGEWAIAAAERNNRVVQMGNQRRSWPALIEAVQKIKDGEIGKTLYARTWYNNRRASIGHGKVAPTPDWLDWDLWQGPAPRREFKDNVLHYNWHWHWHWGNGEMGNNGIHGLDVARWALDVAFPTRVTAGGGKYRHDDDQETPDTMMATFDFPEGKTITWEGLSWSALGPHDTGFGISIHGTEGSVVMRGAGYTIYDMKNKEISTGTGASGDKDHFADFLGAVRSPRLTNSNIEEAHRSTLMCHLGNIAFRTGAVLTTNAENGHIENNDEANKLWSREYAKGWEPKTA
ncbi:Inositol 2-dehydrogenase [Novipirellula galeiformis]|uniref:Inositol 2-dehydrogenase n=1 Tax=Novipirellula galeiformis TaxID=2528004 RepID=A0A5C6CLQ4_9BACT|nr:Gfo/Idh/MocA family oxidoreductase [Novipirellula galeiformis]TWU25005.1 Inositol 2-dehydrogenase [Novipirellula galeiformis]